MKKSIRIKNELLRDILVSNSSSLKQKQHQHVKFLFLVLRPSTCTARSLALQRHFNSSFCDTHRGLGVRNKGSTQYVVKGSQKEFPRELLQELKIVCQVQNSWLI
ncbi:hypothetical protein GmHk_19G056001 [Glycine max]|nr:hypothetical protein GmHk_19G056001 [Glycine max]